MDSQELYPLNARKTILEAVEQDVVSFDELFRYLNQAHIALNIAESEILKLKEEAERAKYWDQEKFNERVAEQVSFAVSFAEEEKDKEIEKLKELINYFEKKYHTY